MKRIGFITSLIILICLGLFLANRLFTIRNSRIRLRLQENLAAELGVRIKDYPWETDFPEGYFFTILKPGMTIDEITALIKGYEKVYHCKTLSEIFYYFSSEETKALRFEVRFDDKGNYPTIIGEDPNSHTIFLDGCTPGWIGGNDTITN